MIRSKFLSPAILFSMLILNLETKAQGEWCGTMHRTNQLIESDIAYAQQFENFQQQLMNIASANANREANAYEVIYIPVVFHIVHNGDAIGSGENITDAQVLSQLPALNRDYNALDPDQVNIPIPFQSLVGNASFKFCLAKFDPDGNPTTGIIRHQFAQTTWNTENDIDQTLKPATIWDRSRYLNIWTVAMGGDLASNGVLAYSSFPFFGNANADGIVARYNTVGTTGNLMQNYTKGKTISHEAGHYFGLLHTWGTGPGCTGQGDFVADTPVQDVANYVCRTFPYVSCAVSAPNGDMYMNYMDYAPDNCSSLFTIGQVTNMRGTIDGFRASLKSASSQCFYNLDAAILNVVMPRDTICALNFRPAVTLRNEGQTTLTSATFYYQIDGGGVQIFNWSGSLTSQNEVLIFLPSTSVASGNHNFDISVGNINGQSADNFAGNNDAASTFYAYEGGSAISLPFTEGFEVSFPLGDWNIINPNNDVTWVQDFYGAFGLSSACMKIDNFSYLTNPNKKKDAFTTPPYDLSNVTYPELKFDVAYARRDANKFDSLNVYYSINCGSTWVKIWNQRGSELATAPDKTTLFAPAPNEWKTVSVPLTSIVGLGKVSFKFENVTGWGNVLYVDNINLSNNPSLSVGEVQKITVNIFPNPASNMVAVRLPTTHPFNTVSILNQIGEEVVSEQLSGSSTIFSLENLANGLYFVQLKGRGVLQTEKLIVVR